MTGRAQSLLIVGNRGGTNVGESLLEASKDIVTTQLIESRRAMEGPRLLRTLAWRLGGRRPLRLRAFGDEVVASCRHSHSDVLLATGIAGLDSTALQQVGELGAQRVLFVTDDPWNPAHRAQWFLRTLPLYDRIFTTKRATVADLQAASTGEVSFLPFAYDPRFWHASPTEMETDSVETTDPLESDVMFAGGADEDRVPYIAALAAAGFRVALFGDYWYRFPATRSLTRGQTDAETVRKAALKTKVALCMVRRANRDGHAMRTFELPASGACMLTEFTEEHCEIFGEEGRTVQYFRTIAEMVEKAAWLIGNAEERRRLARAAHDLITRGGHTYRDRLLTILNTLSPPRQAAATDCVA
ncbi:MAG TPA: glycosyltransferase [Bryobacteraceae bacterium]|jgi:spore maturation protein CgeB